MYNAIEILTQYAHGLIRRDEAERELDRQEVRGGFDSDGFCGYDYRKQEWIVVSFRDLRRAA